MHANELHSLMTEFITHKHQLHRIQQANKQFEQQYIEARELSMTGRGYSLDGAIAVKEKYDTWQMSVTQETKITFLLRSLTEKLKPVLEVLDPKIILFPHVESHLKRVTQPDFVFELNNEGQIILTPPSLR